MKRKKLSWSLAIVISLLLGVVGIGYAKVTGLCSNCHTMHNSQNNTHMILNTDIDGTSSGLHGGGYPSLTRSSCVGCHTGENTATSTTPFVYDIGPVIYGTNTLAGGNFKWVVTDGDAKGHNVKGIPGLLGDVALAGGAPGALATGCSTTACHETLYNTTEVATGCEGCHLDPKHHAPQQAAGTPALEANGYFRFLSGHENGDGYGVEGIEDSDWQFTNDADDHNEYLGKASSNTFGGFAFPLGIDENTMTAYCTGCHGKFHTQVDTNSNWIRHPSDAVLPSSGEYTAYSTYDPNVPVARAALTAVSNTVGSTDMVMCLSCHRAHGSPNDDMLRWSYTGMVAGGGGADGTGCFKCHSEKDQ